eukprot:COSAG03_NODE_9644_length_703_cov_2.736755_1_plen_60_part_10
MGFIANIFGLRPLLIHAFSIDGEVRLCVASGSVISDQKRVHWRWEVDLTGANQDVLYCNF